MIDYKQKAKEWGIMINKKIGIAFWFCNQWSSFFIPKQHSIIMFIGIDVMFDEAPMEDIKTKQQSWYRCWAIRFALLGLEVGIKLVHLKDLS